MSLSVTLSLSVILNLSVILSLLILSVTVSLSLFRSFNLSCYFHTDHQHIIPDEQVNEYELQRRELLRQQLRQQLLNEATRQHEEIQKTEREEEEQRQLDSPEIIRRSSEDGEMANLRQRDAQIEHHQFIDMNARAAHLNPPPPPPPGFFSPPMTGVYTSLIVKRNILVSDLQDQYTRK